MGILEIYMIKYTHETLGIVNRYMATTLRYNYIDNI